MKHLLTFLRHGVSATLASTVGSPSAHRRGTMLKHYAFMLLFLLGSLNVWGYTITFSPGSGDGTSASTSTACSTIVSDGASYLSGNLVTATRVYYSGDYGLKLGASSNAGTIKMNLASSVTPTSIVVRAKLYNSSKATTLKVNGSATQNITTDFSNLTFNITSSTSYIQLESSKYCWIESITVNTGSSEPTVSVTPESWDFGTVHASAEASKVFSVSGSNLTAGNLTLTVPDGFSVDPSSIAVDGTLAATNVTVSKSTSTEDDYAGNLSITGGGLASAKTVGLTMTVDADPEPTGTFNKYTGTTLPDGYYVICSGSTTTAMKNTALSGPRIGYATVDIESNTITNPDESVVWKLENLTGDDAGYFTLYNEAVAKYAAFTSADGKANVIDEVTDYAKFALKENSSFDFLNKGKTGRYLRLNGTNGFANYASTTGAALTLYKKASAPKAITIDNSIENGSVGVSGIANLSEVAEGTDVTLTNAPVDGYKLSAYDVYKTGEPSTKVTVTNGQFTMPDYDVTVSATFEVAKVLTSIEITTPASQNTFWVGETFNYDGLVVTAHFEGAADEVVTPTSISEPAMNVAGEQTITVSYEEGTTTKTTNYTIDVKALPTEANPGSVADMIDIWNKLGDQSDMYVRGTIYQINGFYSETYITYWITDSYNAGAEPNHTNEFELYNGLDFGGAPFSAKEDLELGQEVVVKGNLTRFGKNAPYTYEFGSENIIISRPKVLKSIALSGSQPTEFTQGDEFSSEGLVVTATYNYGNNAIVTPTSITGYDMSAPGNQTVTVSYTESGVTKTATYGISVAAPDLCEHKATISKGEEVNGTFELSVSGELCLDELSENKTSTILTASPATHYHLSEVTATVGTVGAISDNSCTISEINASTTITAVFVEDAKATLTFARGEATGTDAAPENIVDYIGETVQLPANPFTYTGHKFAGWSCDGGTTKLAAGVNYTLVGDKAFVAQWKEIPNFANGDWILVKDAAELSEGSYVIIASADANVAMQSYASGKNCKGKGDAEKSGDLLTYNSDYGVFEIGDYEISEDTYKTFFDVETEQYLFLGADDNQLKAQNAKDANAAWTITSVSSEGVAVVKSKSYKTRSMRYNSSNTLFACYTSGQGDVAFYKYHVPSLKLSYDANAGGDAVTNLPGMQIADGENKVTVSSETPLRENYIFKGWKDGESNDYAAGDEITLSENMTLYAQWRDPNTYSISYDANGGTLIEGESEITPTSVTEGNAYTIEENVYEVEGKLFIGWKANGVTYNAGQEIYPTENMTFVAQWGDPNVTDFMLVTDVKQLKDGDKVYIVAAEYNVAMGTQHGTDYRNYVEIAKQNNRVVILNATPVEFTLGKDGDNFTFKDGTGYLYASSSSSNNLNTKADLDNNGKWAISINANGVASIIAQGDKLRKDMRYNASSGQERFSCYATSTTMKAVSIYKRPDYTRNVSGNYGTICLPQAGQIIGATLYEIAYYGEASKKIFFDEIVNGEMEAGIPYIFQPAAGVEKINVYYSDNTAENVGAGNRNGFIGFYDLNNPAARHDIDEDAGFYILYNNQYWLVSGRAAYVENYRAYIKLADITPSEPTLAPGRRRISMSVNDTQTTTGFENAEANEAPHKVLINGELFILRGEKMYDATGRLVK